MNRQLPTTLIEYGTFDESWERLINTEKDLLFDLLSENPRLGQLVANTGGIRRLDWPQNSLNKRDVQAVVYYFYKDRSTPVSLIQTFKVGTKQTLAKCIEILVQSNP